MGRTLSKGDYEKKETEPKSSCVASNTGKARQSGDLHVAQEEVQKRLILTQLEYVFSRVHELPSGQVVAILLCELMALKAGATVRECKISLAGNRELDLGDPDDIPCYDKLIRGLPQFPPLVLNRWLRGEVSLPRGRKLTGIIIATGWESVPAEYPDEMPAAIKLSVIDEHGNHLQFRLRAGVDRSAKRIYERKLRERWDTVRSKPHVGLYEPGESQLAGQEKTLWRDRQRATSRSAGNQRNDAISNIPRASDL